ncbi:MAG: hypothetical protein WCX97_03570 [Candidatus Magasanikbacteria bacterium]
MKRLSGKFILILMLVMGAVFFLSAHAETSEQTINVTLEVPSSSTCGNTSVCESGETCASCSECCGPGPGDTYPPSISNIASSTTESSAIVSWTASDSSQPVSCLFTYNGNSASYSKSDNNFTVNLTNLLANTVYNFSFTCSDSVGNTTAPQVGSFTTLGITIPLSITTSSVMPDVTKINFFWDTNKAASGEVNYGETESRVGTATDIGSGTASHSAQAIGLKSCFPYYYRIHSWDGATDPEVLGSVITLSEITPPASVGSLTLATTSASIILSWVNPADLDFKEVKIKRNDIEIYRGSNVSYTDSVPPLACGTNYCYKFSSFDYCGNESGEAFPAQCGRVNCTPPSCGNGSVEPALAEDCEASVVISKICTDFNPLWKAGVVKCGSSCKYDTSGCKLTCGDGIVSSTLGEQCESTVAITKQCSDFNPLWNQGVVKCSNSCEFDLTNCSTGNDNRYCGDGTLDVDLGEQCDDGAANASCPTANRCSVNCQWNNCLSIENCGNDIDDNGNGLIDCADPSCANDSRCKGDNEEAAACLDGLDNDGDGLIDYPSDPGCSSVNDTDEYNSPKITVPELMRLSLDDVLFFAGNRNINLALQNQTVTSLSGSHFTVGIRALSLATIPQSLNLRVGAGIYNFSYSEIDQVYYADLSFPAAGAHQAYIEVDYGSDQLDSLEFNLSSLVRGEVWDNNGRVPGVEMTLYQEGGKLFPAANYGQSNPQFTDINGTYDWVVPNGNYFIKIESEKYFSHQTQLFAVKNNVVNRSLRLILKPVKITDIIPANIARAQQALQETVNNPIVEQTASVIVAPATIAVVSAGVAATVSWLDLLAWLRFLFLQPLLIFGRRKRLGWGQVYNSLNKLPIDLATVRLISVASGKIIQSKVTDKNGRYLFIVNPGEYRLEVFKNNFVFPSGLLDKIKSDGRHLDIYHGEVIKATEKNAVITANVPLDPAGETKTPWRISKERFLRRLQITLARLGLIIALVSLYIAPVWYMWVLLAAHIIAWLVFRRLARPVKAKGWGIVYDADSRQPLGRTIARLFDSRFNKLVATEITDRHGRYSFLAGDSQFYVTYENKGYQQKQTDVIDLSGQEQGTLALDVGLNKSSEPKVDSQKISASDTQPLPPLNSISSVSSPPKVVSPVDTLSGSTKAK